MDLYDWTVLKLRDAILGRRITAREAVHMSLQAIERYEPAVQAFLSVDAEHALDVAERIDRRIEAGEPVGVLAGVPVAVKDNICTRRGKTTCASRILENFRAPYDAHVVERLCAADAVIVGKTNMDEFAMGSSTENSGFKPTHNPWDRQRVPGGSSGGSAAAVAAGMCAAALGSDTGGSIRQPASLCGVVGLKPTYGRVSRYGLVAYGSSLDQIGPLCRDVADAALMLNVIAGHDRRDSTSVSEQIAPVPDYLAQLEEPLDGLKLGVISEFMGSGLDEQVRRAIEAALELYESLGAHIVEVSLPHSKYAVATYYLVATAEASSNLARYDGVHYGYRCGDCDDMIEMYIASRSAGFGEEVKRRIMLGTYALSSGYYDAYYLKALKVRRLIKEDFDRAFEKVDCIASPTSPTTAFRIGEKIDDPLTMYLSDIYTISANLAGVPGISIPAGVDDVGLPIGLQLLAPVFQEQKLLRVARMFERATDYHKRRPPLLTEQASN